MRLRRNFRPRPRPEKFQSAYTGVSCQIALVMEEQLFEQLERTRKNARVVLPNRKMK